MKCLRDFVIFAFDSAANRVMIFEQALACDLTMFPGRTDGWMDRFEEKDPRPIAGPRSRFSIGKCLRLDHLATSRPIYDDN